MGNSHRAKRYPSSVSAPIYPIKRAERVLKCQKGLFFLPFGLLSREIFLVRRHQIQRSANFEAMGCTRGTAHCRDNSLAAVDDDLSQEINLLLEGVRLGLSQKKIPSG